MTDALYTACMDVALTLGFLDAKSEQRILNSLREKV